MTRTVVGDVFFVSYRKSRDWPYGRAASREHLVDLLTRGEGEGADFPSGSLCQLAIVDGAIVELERARE